jgi:hypothetical protein
MRDKDKPNFKPIPLHSVTLVPVLQDVADFQIQKSICRSHTTIIKVRETTIKNIESIDPRDLDLVNTLREKAKTHFIRTITDCTRYQLNLLLALRAFSGKHVDIGSVTVPPAQRGVSKTCLYSLMDYASNKRLNEDLMFLVSKGFIYPWVANGRTDRPRTTFFITSSGYRIISQHDAFYSRYLKQCFELL